MTALRLSWLFVRSAAVGTVVALVLAAAVPVVVGGRSFSVLSGSMEPNISTGDLVITLPIAPADAVPGDIVTFNDPIDESRLITHRVASSTDVGEKYRFVTKGDANNSVERWSVPTSGRIGKVMVRLPKLGYVMTATRSPAARVALVTLPALLLAGFALASIWRRPSKEKEAADAAATA